MLSRRGRCGVFDAEGDGNTSRHARELLIKYL